MSRQVAVALVGTTASGKSALAHDLARERGNLEIATVDSMTVYREMDIATAKATPSQRREVPYHLLDLADPSEEFTVAQFQRAAREVEDDVGVRGRQLLYVGGTGLYGRAVLDQLAIPGQFPAIRAELEVRAADDLDSLFRELVQQDPLAASRMERTNARRVVRALEVTLGSGRPFSSYGEGLVAYPAVRVAQVGLRVRPDELDRRIEERFSSFLREGLLDEVRALSARREGLSRTARQAVGYRELLAHVEDGVDLATAIDEAMRSTRRLARRQRRWFARDPRIEWFDTPEDARERICQLLTPGVPDVGN